MLGDSSRPNLLSLGRARRVNLFNSLGRGGPVVILNLLGSRLTLNQQSNSSEVRAASSYWPWRTLAQSDRRPAADRNA